MDSIYSCMFVVEAVVVLSTIWWVSVIRNAFVVLYLTTVLKGKSRLGC